METPETRICPACQEPRLVSQFRKRKDGVTRRARCRRCVRRATAQAQAAQDARTVEQGGPKSHEQPQSPTRRNRGPKWTR